MPIGTVGATSAAAAAATAAADSCADQQLLDTAIAKHGQCQIAECMRSQKVAVFRVPSSLHTQLDLLGAAMQEVVELAEHADAQDANAAAAATSSAAAAARSTATAVGISASSARRRRRRRQPRKAGKSYAYKQRRVDPIGGGRKQLKLSKLATVEGGAKVVPHASDCLGKGLINTAGLPGVRMGECSAIWGGKRPQVAHVDNSHGVVYNNKQFSVHDPLMINWLVPVTDAGVKIALYADTLEGTPKSVRRKRDPVIIHVKKGWALMFHHLLYHLGLVAEDGLSFRLHYYGEAALVCGGWASGPIDSTYKDNKMRKGPWKRLV
jgi:hypothetical protein